MLTIDAKKLIEAIKESQEYQLPEMDEGTAYLHENLFERLRKGESLTFSDFDYDAFEREDLESISDFHKEVFLRQSQHSQDIISALEKQIPSTVAVAFV